MPDQRGRTGGRAHRYQVPATVSREAAKELAALYAATSQAPVRGRPASLADWDASNAAMLPMFEALSTATADRLRVVCSAEVIGGVRVLRLRPADLRLGTGLLVYLHGGAYTLLSARSTLTLPALMAAKSGCEVVSVDYTLAPRARWPAVTDEVLAVWRALLQCGGRPENIAFFGESAGGGLAAGAVLNMRDQGLALPAALALLSSWSDISGQGDSLTTLADADPILNPDLLAWSAAAYAGPAEQLHPYVSPVYGSYAAPFPPTLIQVGTREMFPSHSVRHYQAVRAGGHDAVLDIYEGMPHAHPALRPSAPETRVAVARASDFLLGRLVG